MKKALAMIEQGHPAPALDLPTDNGGRVSLTALRGKPAVVYFYPKDDTTGCTREAQDFTALAAEFAALGATVIGVSKDTVKKHDRFKAKYGPGRRPGLRRGRRGLRGLGRVGAEEAVRSRIYGH